MQLYIFDIDGTLTDSTKVDDKCFIRTFEQHFGERLEGIDFSTFQNVTDWGITIELIERLQKRAISEKEILTFKKAFVTDLDQEAQANPQQFQAIEGAKDYLVYLQEQKNIALAIATGAWAASANIKLHYGGIPYYGIPLSHSDNHISREEIVLDAIQKAKNHYQFDFKDIRYFGDGVWDFKTCANLGIPFIGVDYHQNGKLKKLGAKKIINNYTVLLN